MLQSFLKNLNLNVNEAVRIDCPICFHNKTFSALNTGEKIVYNCFHADCNIKGRTRSELSKRLFNEVEKQKEPEIFYYRNHWEENLENKDYREYVTHYDLQDYYEIMRYDRHTHRAVFLVKKEGFG